MKLNLPLTSLYWTKVPNYLIDTLLPKLTDTELRVLLIVLRRTYGFNRPTATVTLPYRRLMLLTGRSSSTVWSAVRSLQQLGLVHSSRYKGYQESAKGVSESGKQQ